VLRRTLLGPLDESIASFFSSFTYQSLLPMQGVDDAHDVFCYFYTSFWCIEDDTDDQ